LTDSGPAIAEKSTAREAVQPRCCSAQGRLQGNRGASPLQFWLEIVDNDIRAAHVPIADVLSGLGGHRFRVPGSETHARVALPNDETG